MFEFISKIEQGYINQRPNLQAMKRLINGLGWTVEYKHGFTDRWWMWILYYDCEYELVRNYNDMRNYTS